MSTQTARVMSESLTFLTGTFKSSISPWDKESEVTAKAKVPDIRAIETEGTA